MESQTTAPKTRSATAVERPTTRRGKPLKGIWATTAAILGSSAATEMTCARHGR